MRVRNPWRAYVQWRRQRAMRRSFDHAIRIIVLFEQQPRLRERFRRALFDGGLPDKTPGFGQKKRHG